MPLPNASSTMKGSGRCLLLTILLRLALRFGLHLKSDIRDGVPRIVNAAEQQQDRGGADDKQCGCGVFGQSESGRCQRRIRNQWEHDVPDPVFKDGYVVLLLPHVSNNGEFVNGANRSTGGD